MPHADTLSQRQRHQCQLGGSRYGLIGRNGVGKSTLLRAMAERDGQGHSGILRSTCFLDQQLFVGCCGAFAAIFLAFFHRDVLSAMAFPIYEFVNKDHH